MGEFCFELTPLTPIHIGTGEILEPFEYVIDADALHRFALDRFMPELPPDEQARFVKAVEEDVPTIRRFVTEHRDVAARAAQFAADVSSAARDLYEQRVEGETEPPEVMTCIRTGGQAFIPGSSLKGALRTALLYHTMEKDNPEWNARKLEQNAFRFKSVQQDPFRAFKVGDGSVLEDRTQIYRVDVWVLRDSGWDDKLSLLVENVPGALSDGIERTSKHRVTFDANYYRYHQRAFLLNAEAVLSACRDFYGTHLETERKATHGLEAAAVYEALAKRAKALPDHACLVRLAWGSGRDATTVAYALRGSERPRSRRLTSEGFPLGWAELAIYDAEGQPFVPEEEIAAVGAPPERRPRDERPRSLRDLQPGMILKGTVRRTVTYGAFVDVGVERDGLVHISKLADHFVNLVEEIVIQGDRVRVEVLDVDVRRRRISLKLVEVLPK